MTVAEKGIFEVSNQTVTTEEEGEEGEEGEAVCCCKHVLFPTEEIPADARMISNGSVFQSRQHVGSEFCWETSKKGPRRTRHPSSYAWDRGPSGALGGQVTAAIWRLVGFLNVTSAVRRLS